MSIPGDKHKPDIPKNYFDRLNLDLEQKLLDEDIFDKEDYPILFGINKSLGFITPKDYLANFKPNTQARSLKSSQIFKPLLFSLLTIIALCIFALSTKNESNQKKEIKSEEIIRYFAEEDEFLDDYFDDELEYLLYEESENIFTDLEEETLIDYLQEDLDVLDLAMLY